MTKTTTMSFWFTINQTVLLSSHTEIFIKSTGVVMVTETGLCILWLISIVACIIMFIIKIFQKILKKEKRPLGTWAVLLMIAELSIIGAAVFIAVNALNYKQADFFFWMFYVIFALLLLIITLIIFGVVKFRKSEMKKGTKTFNFITLCTLALSIANVLYWNIFCFWIT